MWLSSCWPTGSFSFFFDKDVLQSFGAAFWKFHFRRKPGELPSQHLQITSTGKMWLTQITVSSLHGYYSESGCCLKAKSLEIRMTSVLLLKNWVYTHRKQGGGGRGDSCKTATVLAIWGIRADVVKEWGKTLSMGQECQKSRPADQQQCFYK